MTDDGLTVIDATLPLIQQQQDMVRWRRTC